MYQENYINKNINIDLTADVVTNVERGGKELPLMKNTIKLSVKSSRGRRMNSLSVCYSVQFSLIHKTKNEKDAPVLDRTFPEILSEIKSVNFLVNYLTVIAKYLNEFGVIITDKPLYKVFAEDMDISTFTSREAIKILVNNKVFKRLSPKRFIVNPYIINDASLGLNRLYQIQIAWDKDIELQEWLNLGDYTKHREETIKLIEAMLEQVKADLVKKDELYRQNNDYDLLDDEYNSLMKHIKKNKHWASATLSEFGNDLVKQNKLKTNTVAGINAYIINDDGSRHFYNWFNKVLNYDDIKINYRRRNKFVKWFIDYSDYANREEEYLIAADSGKLYKDNNYEGE